MDQTDADWQQWYDRHGPALLLYARQVTRSLAEAEDAVPLMQSPTHTTAIHSGLK